MFKKLSQQGQLIVVMYSSCVPETLVLSEILADMIKHLNFVHYFDLFQKKILFEVHFVLYIFERLLIQISIFSLCNNGSFISQTVGIKNSGTVFV